MINKQILTFIIIGIINTIFYYFLFSSFIYFGFDYRLAILFATLIGVIFSFRTFGKYVFKNESWIFFMRFFLVYICLYGLNIYIVSCFKVVGIYLAGMIALIPITVLTFLLNKYFVFNDKLNFKENKNG